MGHELREILQDPKQESMNPDYNLNAKDGSCPGVSLYFPRFMTSVLMAAWWVGRGRMREKAQILDKVGSLFGDPLYKPQKRRENAEAFAYLKLDSK